jgi:hypothetical protein
LPAASLQFSHFQKGEEHTKGGTTSIVADKTPRTKATVPKAYPSIAYWFRIARKKFSIFIFWEQLLSPAGKGNFREFANGGKAK